jgi:hypothetical protein
VGTLGFRLRHTPVPQTALSQSLALARPPYQSQPHMTLHGIMHPGGGGGGLKPLAKGVVAATAARQVGLWHSQDTAFPALRVPHTAINRVPHRLQQGEPATVQLPKGYRER